MTEWSVSAPMDSHTKSRNKEVSARVGRARREGRPSGHAEGPARSAGRDAASRAALEWNTASGSASSRARPSLITARRTRVADACSVEPFGGRHLGQLALRESVGFSTEKADLKHVGVKCDFADLTRLVIAQDAIMDNGGQRQVPREGPSRLPRRGQGTPERGKPWFSCETGQVAVHMAPVRYEVQFSATTPSRPRECGMLPCESGWEKQRFANKTQDQ